MSKDKLKFHKGQIDCVKSFIKSFQFDDGNLVSTNYVEFEKLDENLLKDKILQANFDRYQLGSFIQKLAYKLLLKTHESASERKVFFESEDWINSCVNKVVTTLESFPLEYLGMISLPALTAKFPLNLEITSQISIKTTSKSTNENSLLSALMKARGYSFWQTELLPNTPYITIKVKGYSNGGINTTASNEFLSSLKQFLALVLIFNLVTADKYMLGFDTNQKIINSDRTVTPHWVMKTTILNEPDSMHMEVPPELAAFINTINLNTKDLITYAKDPNAKTILGSVIKKYPEDDNEFNEALLEKFAKGTSFFNLDETFDKKRISAALEWFLEAKTTTNQSVSLIYFCIGLEAILGDESNSRELQLKEKLADRVAYMIGDTNSQRSKLKEDFKAIYSARSDLVHAKESRITKQNTELLGKAEVMLKFLISREINGLMKSKK